LSHEDKISSFLKHYGVPGMKWGVRKSRNEAARARQFAPSKESVKATKAYKKAKTSGVKSLTNKEIRDFNERVRLEQQFHSLSPKGKIRRGLDFAQQLTKTGRTINEAMAFANSPAGTSIREAFEKQKS
jgi:hypothetical protein